MLSLPPWSSACYVGGAALLMVQCAAVDGEARAREEGGEQAAAAATTSRADASITRRLLSVRQAFFLFSQSLGLLDELRRKATTKVARAAHEQLGAHRHGTRRKGASHSPRCRQ